MNFSAVFAAAAMLLAGCDNRFAEDMETSYTDDATYIPIDVCVHGSVGMPSGRTSIVYGHKVVWSKDDRVGLFAPGIYASWHKLSSSGRKLSLRKELLNFPLAAATGSEASSLLVTAPEGLTNNTYTEYDGWLWKVSNTGDADMREFYAYYPYDAASPFANYTNWNRRFVFRLDEVQVQTAIDDSSHVAGYDMLWGKAAIAKPDGTADKDEFVSEVVLDFVHLFALLEYRVTNSTGKPVTVGSITLDGGGVPLAGEYEIDADTDDVEWASSAVSNVVLNLGDAGFELAAGESFTAYMVVAPAVLASASVKVVTNVGEQSFAVDATFSSGKWYSKSLVLDNVEESYELVTVDFEDIVSSGQSEFLADSSFGDNVDGKSKYVPYRHSASGLIVSLNRGAYQPDSYEYHRCGGGFWGSNYNDMTSVGVMNHSSVYYSDAVTGRGGHGGSEYFAVCFESSSSGISYTNAQIGFADDATERVFDHLWVNNTTFAVLDMEGAQGALNEQFSYSRKSWCKLVVTGVRADGSESGSVEFYLADFRTPDAGGIVREWSRIDLAALGSVHSLKFSMDSSDKDTFLGAEALNNPAYFCVDDIAVRM